MGDRVQIVDELARLDPDREAQLGIPEAIFAEGKLVEQVIELCRQLCRSAGRAIVTRLGAGHADELARVLRADGLTVEIGASGRLAVVRTLPHAVVRRGGLIGLLAAGTSDIPVAEEARLVAREMGCEVITHYDVGIAGLQRLVAPLRELVQRQVAVVIVVAGMEGALPSVVRATVPFPVIGVPTSVGYGHGGQGAAALASMLQSCAPGLTVVNIDNGFGAGATAALYANRLALVQAARDTGAGHE